jgi:spore maturation protein CgeB
MKVLIVGSNGPSAIERYYVKYLRQFGATVHHYPSADIVYKQLSKNILNRILFKTKLRTWYRGVNKELLKKADELKPDIIWVFKGMEIYPETLKQLRKKNFTLANYNPDHPFIIAGSGSGNKNVMRSVGIYHLHFCYHNSLRKEIEERFHIPTVFLPFAFEHTDMIYTDPSEITEINKVCFQGNPDKYRVSKIELLTAHGFDVDVYGIGWQRTRLSRNKHIRIFGIAPRPEFWKMNQQYRLQLNLFREHNFGSHNMRTFEIPAVGGIQLTPYSDEQAAFFEDSREIFFFNGDHDMIDKIRTIFSMQPEMIKAIRASARKRSMESGYSFEDRSLLVYNTFKQLV